MANLKIRYLIVIVLLILTALIINSQQYNSSQDDEIGRANLQKIPMQIGKWKGQDIILDETVYDILETRAIIHRSFVAENGDSVFLSLVHYNDTKVDFHAPEACLGGRGESTTKITKAISLFSGVQQKTIDIAEITAKRTTGETLTYYFFKSGKFIGSNYIKMRLSIAANKFTMNDTRGSLVRISTILNTGEKAVAEAVLIDFIEDLFPYIQLSL